MKKIIFTEKKGINISEVTNDSFVGILWKDGDRSIIVRAGENDYRYLHNFGKTTNLGTSYTSIQKLLMEVTKDIYFKDAVVLESYDESLTWLTEKLK